MVLYWYQCALCKQTFSVDQSSLSTDAGKSLAVILDTKGAALYHIHQCGIDGLEQYGIANLIGAENWKVKP